MSKLSKKEFNRQKRIIDSNIKYSNNMIDKCKSDISFNKQWNINEFELSLLFWKSMKNNLELCKKLYTD